jgi:hypothetical protein
MVSQNNNEEKERNNDMKQRYRLLVFLFFLKTSGGWRALTENDTAHEQTSKMIHSIQFVNRKNKIHSISFPAGYYST